MNMAIASGSKQNAESATVVDKEIEEHENDQTTEPSLHQVKSAYSLQRVKSAGISPVREAEFKPTTRLYLAFGTLAVITLMVALDGTSLSVALPVGFCPYISPTCVNQSLNHTSRSWHAP